MLKEAILLVTSAYREMGVKGHIYKIDGLWFIGDRLDNE